VVDPAVYGYMLAIVGATEAASARIASSAPIFP
jgi:hypothetical protein